MDRFYVLAPACSLHLSFECCDIAFVLRRRHRLAVVTSLSRAGLTVYAHFFCRWLYFGCSHSKVVACTPLRVLHDASLHPAKRCLCNHSQICIKIACEKSLSYVMQQTTLRSVIVNFLLHVAAGLFHLHDPTSLQLKLAQHILFLRHTHAAVLLSGLCHKHFSFSICLVLFRQQQSKHNQQPSAQTARPSFSFGSLQIWRRLECTL